MNNINIWVTESPLFFHQEVIYDPKFKLSSMFSVEADLNFSAVALCISRLIHCHVLSRNNPPKSSHALFMIIFNLAQEIVLFTKDPQE